jgi:hypothetical protein
MVSGLFKSIPGVTVLKNLVRIFSNHWLTAIMIDRKIVGKTNEDLRLALEAVNIESRPLWKPMQTDFCKLSVLWFRRSRKAI